MMSGRSAYVRKEKTKVKDGMSDATSLYIGEFPMPLSSKQQAQQSSGNYGNQADYATIRTQVSSGSDAISYSRVQMQFMPEIKLSGIEKSSFRAMMDSKSEGIRKGLAKTFKSKNRKESNEQRALTSPIDQGTASELDLGSCVSSPTFLSTLEKEQTNETQGYSLPEHSGDKLPMIPQGPQLKRWVGGGKHPRPWNKLGKDPELWDPTGDTLIYFGHEENQKPRPPASFRVSSHMIESTESRFLVELLREGAIDNGNALGSLHNSPSISEDDMSGFMAGDGQISYEMYFVAPLNQSKTETLRHQVTTRNLFALLFNASLVGLNLYQALSDLLERLEVYMPPEYNAAEMIVDYLMAKGLDDVRESPSGAAAILSWSEAPNVRCDEVWKEAFVHAAGMYHRFERCGDYRFVSPITRALLERASLEIQVRVQNAQERLANFDFSDMWPIMSENSPPSRGAFERFGKFLTQHYELYYEKWPPATRGSEVQWLSKNLTQALQKDFAALYDFLVNREISWKCSEGGSGQKWNMVLSGSKSFEADTPDLPLTDIFIAFDNRHEYPHIPHPYPVVPDSISVSSPLIFDEKSLLKYGQKPQLSNASENRMAQRKVALAYTESTNIFLLGSDFVSNDLVEAFVRFEKTDRVDDIDPHSGRRGRWVLIYGILQTLASLAVDTPNLRFTDNVSYHLNASLKGTPPWREKNQIAEKTTHVKSHCWTVRRKWDLGTPHSSAPSSRRRIMPISVSPGKEPVTTDSPYSLRGNITQNERLLTGEQQRCFTPNDVKVEKSTYRSKSHKLGEWPSRAEDKASKTVNRQGNQRNTESGSQRLNSKASPATQRETRERIERDLIIRGFDDYSLRGGIRGLKDSWLGE